MSFLQCEFGACSTFLQYAGNESGHHVTLNASSPGHMTRIGGLVQSVSGQMDEVIHW